MNEAKYEFTVSISAGPSSSFPLPILDHGNNIIGAFTYFHWNTFKCFVAGNGWIDSIYLDDQFWFTPIFNGDNAVTSGRISSVKESNSSIKVNGAERVEHE